MKKNPRVQNEKNSLIPIPSFTPVIACSSSDDDKENEEEEEKEKPQRKHEKEIYQDEDQEENGIVELDSSESEEDI
eukprot:6274676-Ditylum_brightwellii.AAC.1